MEENNNNPNTFANHIKIIEHNASALAARIAGFLSAEEHQSNSLSSRLMAYGKNLANEIESLALRQDYSECRYRGLLELIDDCENNLNSLNCHGNRCTKETNALKRLLESSESNPSKRMRKSADQDGSPGFVCPFCSDRIEDKNHKAVSNHDIVNHLKCHENKSFQCVKCNAFFASNTNVLNHILLQHADDKIKYFHNHALGLETVTVQLGCNICGMIFKTSHQAVSHFENNHYEQRIDLNAVPSIETTKFDLQTDLAVGNFGWNIRPQLHCDKCEHPEETIPKLLIHYNKEHPLKPVVAKRGQILVAHNADENWQSNILYGCVHCKAGTDNVNFLFDSINAVHVHWQENHTKAPNFKPFQFCVVSYVACFHCNRISTFDDLVIHHKKRHSKEPFVVVDVNSRRKCGVCQDGFEDMAKHFIELHTKTLDRIVVSNPIRLNCEQLLKVLSFNLHKKMKCGHCNEIFDCNGELRKHWGTMHPNEKRNIHSFFNDDRIRIVLDCCSEEYDRSRLAKHFMEHDFRFHCNNCGFVTKKLGQILRHDREQHVQTHDAQRRSINFVKKLKNLYFNGKIIFGNGFVANGFNLRNTKYDDTQVIDNFVSKFENQELD